jgi:hypothetical protein
MSDFFYTFIPHFCTLAFYFTLNHSTLRRDAVVGVSAPLLVFSPPLLVFSPPLLVFSPTTGSAGRN